MFRSKPEAYAFTISFLTELQKEYPHQPIHLYLNQVQQAFDNHEQNPVLVSDGLMEMSTKIPLKTDHKQALNRLMSNIKQSDYEKQSPQEKFENPLRRRAESEFATTLLLHPTPSMLEAVRRVSLEIINVIKSIEERDRPEEKEILALFLKGLDQTLGIDGLAAFEKVPDLNTVVSMLKENNPQHLPAIMYTHLQFGFKAMRHLPNTTAPTRVPTGHLLDILKQHWQGEPQDFFKLALSISESDVNDKNTLGYRYRALICDTVMYHSPLYKAEPTRGRDGYPKEQSQRTNQMGIMLSNQKEDMQGLPTDTTSNWFADCICLKPSFNSMTVKNLILNDGTYVAGPSGMAAVMLGQMEVLANFENETFKQHYLMAVLSYIVSGGFHSLHEVLAPAAFCLQLIPGYPVSPPDTLTNVLSAPPQLGVAFELFAQVDPEFSALKALAWNKFMTYFKESYIPRCATHLDAIVNPSPTASFARLFDKKKEPSLDVTINEENTLGL